MPKLSEDDLEFIKYGLESDTLTIKEEDGELVGVKTPKVKRSRFSGKASFLRRPMTWGVVILSIGIAFDAFILFSIFRVESALGTGTLEWLSEQEMNDNIRAAAQESGFEWIPQMVDLYNHRQEILLIGFGVPAIIAILLFILDYRISLKRDTKVREDLANELKKEKDLGGKEKDE